ncbi:hypothetical protein AADG42_00600 [Ammonicoccus fulvus]|uniref:Bacterial Ig domain-containing protein n=1 Tax=Ammonicoccus fulvus TaxID=3138240 RepID=A0ABZ3FJR3_9ACTN
MTSAFTRRLAVIALGASLAIGVPAAANAANHIAPAQSTNVVESAPTAAPEITPAEAAPTAADRPVASGSQVAETTTVSEVRTAPARQGKPTEDPRAQQAKDNQARKMTLEATQPTEQYGEVTVSGRGFPKNSEVTVMISNGSAIKVSGNATVKPNGRFSTALTPAEPWRVGTYQVWVSYPGGTKEITLEVTNDLPSTGATALTATTPTSPSDAITLSGTAFTPNPSLRVWVQQQGTSVLPVSTTVAIDVDGAFSVTATPDQPWQSNTTYLVGAQDDNGQFIQTTFTTPAW